MSMKVLAYGVGKALLHSASNRAVSEEVIEECILNTSQVLPSPLPQ